MMNMDQARAGTDAGAQTKVIMSEPEKFEIKIPHGWKKHTTEHEEPQTKEAQADLGQDDAAKEPMTYCEMEGGMADQKIEEAKAKIPGYVPSPSCANCAFSQWNPALNNAFCYIYGVGIEANYICPKYIDPGDLTGEEAENDESSSEPKK